MVENNHVHAPYMMDSLLQEIGLGYVAGKFKEEKVDAGVIMLATFPPISSGNSCCCSSPSCCASLTATRKNTEKKKLGAQNFTGQFICLSDKIFDKIPNPMQKEVFKKAGLGLDKIVFDLEDTEE